MLNMYQCCVHFVAKHGAYVQAFCSSSHHDKETTKKSGGVRNMGNETVIQVFNNVPDYKQCHAGCKHLSQPQIYSFNAEPSCFWLCCSVYDNHFQICRNTIDIKIDVK